MVTERKNSKAPRPRRAPAATIEARENQLITQAIDLAERQLAEGTASAATINHFLKLGSVREQLERDRLVAENELLRKKVESIDSAKNVEALYNDALNAMRRYSGQQPLQESDDY